MINASVQKYLLPLLAFVFLALPHVANAQDGKVKVTVRSEYLWNFGRNMKWTGLDNVDSFHVAFIGKDTAQYHNFRRFVGRRRIKKRPIKATFSEEPKAILDAQMLVVDRQFNQHIDDIYTEIEGKPILLVTDSCQSPRAVMVNFAPSNPLRSVEANEENIEKQGLKIPAVILAMTYKQREDWEEYFKDAEAQLEIERQIVEEQRAEIERKKAELMLIEAEIKALNESLQKKERELSAQESKISAQEASLQELLTNVAKQRQLLQDKTDDLVSKDQEIELKQTLMREQEQAIARQTQILNKTKEEVALHEEMIKEQKGVLQNQQGQIETQKFYIYIAIGGLLLILGICALIWRNYKMKKQANKVLEEKNIAIQLQNEEINQQKEEILSQRDEIEAQREMAVSQRDQIAEQNSEIVDSILYAQRIQNAVLPPMLLVESVIPEHFILNQPRDIVSGDFYWIKHRDGKTYVAVADCTGHGVPGAFMSMLGISSLNEIINSQGALDASELLNMLREKIIYSLHQTGKSGESKDGMDLSLIVIDEKAKKVQFAGANNPIYLVTPGTYEGDPNPRILGNESHTLREIKGDKMPIGIHHSDDVPSFTQHEFDYQKGDACYLFSDGFADQFGGEKGKKFKYKPFKNLLLDHQNAPMSKQKEILQERIDAWRGDLEQVDDILVLGLHLP